jgi:threonine aldolase
MVERLANDHEDAQLLAQGLARIPGILLDPARVLTNMVYFDLGPAAPLDAAGLAARLKAHGILIGPAGPRRIRMCLHYWITPVQVQKTIELVKGLMAG